MNTNDRKQVLGSGISIFIATAIIFAFGILLSEILVFNTNFQTKAITSEPTPDLSEKELEEISENPKNFARQEITIEGKVENVLGKNTIVLNIPGKMSDEEILIISEVKLSDTVTKTEGKFSEKNVKVSGTVNQFSIIEFRDTIDSNISSREMFAYEGQPVIVADKIDLEK